MNSNKFAILCYHYVRSSQSDPFPKILGNKEKDFESQIKLLKTNYNMWTINDLEEIFYKNKEKNGIGIIISFDDGLSDHFRAAEILYKNNVKGIFFIPSCIINEQLPANPIIIHYGIAIYGIEQFLIQLNYAVKNINLENIKNIPVFKKNKDNPWGKIIEIKKFFKYQLEYTNTRKILLNIYKNLLLKNDQDIFEKMHLTKKQIKEMIKMGHTIGSHTHSHVSVAANQLSEEDFEKEILNPKKIIEKEFNTRVISMSYPYGEKNDCLSTIELLDKTNAYKLAFTVAPIRNHSKSSPLEIGRYQPTSRDTTDDILNKIKTIVEKGNL